MSTAAPWYSASSRTTYIPTSQLFGHRFHRHAHECAGYKVGCHGNARIWSAWKYGGLHLPACAQELMCMCNFVRSVVWDQPAGRVVRRSESSELRADRGNSPRVVGRRLGIRLLWRHEKGGNDQQPVRGSTCRVRPTGSGSHESMANRRFYGSMPKPIRPGSYGPIGTHIPISSLNIVSE